MGFFANQSPKIWFTQKVMVVEFEMENEELVGMMCTIGGGGGGVEEGSGGKN